MTAALVVQAVLTVGCTASIGPRRGYNELASHTLGVAS